MIESLADLSSQISKMGGHLMCFYGHNNAIVTNLIKELDINVLCFNADYSPYAIQREIGIIEICDKMGIAVEYGHDYYLHTPGTIVNGQGEPYKKFTPFYNIASKKKVDSPASLRKIHFASSSTHLQNIITLDDAFKRFVGKPNPNILVHGGRTEAIKQMKIAVKTQTHYSETHNDLEKPTSQLSAYIKFGCISIREVYKTFRNKHDFIRQLFWRDFYINILYSFPQVLGHSLKPNYNKIKWHHNATWFKKWCDGETGFPVVDAGMRQLNTTGYMHNRVRLIVASFFTKTLLIDWREGEQYFSQKLVDYDPASNNGNWQWIASTGADSQPYFRIFNPYNQSEQVDEDAVYIKTWIPELKDIPAKELHNWDKYHSMYDGKHNTAKVNYPAPIVNYSVQKEKALEMYNNVFT